MKPNLSLISRLNLSTEWQKTLRYFLSLPTHQQKNRYLASLSYAQKKYLSTWIRKLETLSAPTEPPAPSIPLSSQSLQNPNNSRPQSSNIQSQPATSDQPISNTFKISTPPFQINQSQSSFSFDQNLNLPTQNQWFKPDQPINLITQNKNPKNTQSTTTNTHSSKYTARQKPKNPTKILTKATLALLPFMLIGISFLAYNFLGQPNFLATGLKVENKALASNLGSEYQQWATKNLKNSDKTKPDQDPDQDGLSNLIEYNLNLDPSNPDINKNGKLDGQDILESIDPTNKRFVSKDTRDQIRALVSDNEIVYRLQAITLNKNLDKNKQKPKDLDQLSSKELDLKIEGKLEVAKLNLQDLSVIWNTSNYQDFIEDVLLSLVHYDQTDLPAVNGNTYIFGTNKNLQTTNSEDGLNKLKPNDEIFLTVKTKNSHTKRIKYAVTSKNIYDPSDYQQFEKRKIPELSLATPLQLDTSTKVLVVKSRLVAIEDVVEKSQVPNEAKEDQEESITEGDRKDNEETSEENN